MNSIGKNLVERPAQFAVEVVDRNILNEVKLSKNNCEFNMDWFKMQVHLMIYWIEIFSQSIWWNIFEKSFQFTYYTSNRSAGPFGFRAFFWFCVASIALEINTKYLLKWEFQFTFNFIAICISLTNPWVLQKFSPCE